VSLLRKFSTLKIAGPVERVLWVSQLPEDLSLLPRPIRVLGNGSNVLMDDRGLKGSVILTKEESLCDPELIDEDAKSVLLRVAAGFSLPRLSKYCSSRGWSGCEFMVGVPGTLGGAVVQNAGANGQETAEILKTVECLDLSTGLRAGLSKEECDLQYRSSWFHGRDVLVLSAQIRLQKESPEACQKRVQENLEYRKQKTPYARPSLGSTFTRLKDGDSWIYPGKLIEDCGLKGFRVGAVSVSEQHANYLINEGGGRFEDALAVIEHIERVVLKKTGIQLRREIQIWGQVN